MTPWITKSAFIRGYDCPHRLVYALQRLPSTKANDEFLKMLAEGGFQFERLVRVAWPGTRIQTDRSDLRAASEETLRRIREMRGAGGGVLHEATLVHGRLAARIDMLRVLEDSIELCEIKATSFTGPSGADEALRVVSAEAADVLTAKATSVRSGWLRYVADVAFQTIVAERSLRESGLDGVEVLPRLIAANKSQQCGQLDSFGNLRFRDDPLGASKYLSDEDVVFEVEPQDGFRSPLIGEIDVAVAVDLLRQHDAQSKSERWAGMPLDRMIDDALHLTSGSLVAQVSPERAWKCRDCEFRASDEQHSQSGFARCWGDDAQRAAGLMTLYHGRSYQPGEDHESTGNWLTDQLDGSDGDLAIGDLPADLGEGTRSVTRNMQIEAERSGRTVVSEDFGERVHESLIPDTDGTVLHFLDFETAGACIPFAPGMRPYEIVAFQFSCHSIPYRGDRLDLPAMTHYNWLNDREGPAESVLEDHRRFIDELAQAVGADTGPVFHWATHERTVLRGIRDRLEDGHDAERITFIESLVGPDGESGRLVDMLRVAEGGIMSPDQRGRYSIKNVLPAACRSDEIWELLRQIMGTVLPDAEPQHRDPYRLLPPIDFTRGDEDAVRSGTDAIRAFQQIRFASIARWSDLPRDELMDALTTYCTLDTAAMVAVWAWMIDATVAANCSAQPRPDDSDW